jgi:hypothetical protein
MNPPAQELVRSVRVSPGSLKGRVLGSGTRTPVENQTITVRSAEGGEVSKVVTKADGTYEIPSLAEGDYVVSVGDNVRVDLSVAPDATINTLDIVMPPGTVVPPATPPGGSTLAPASPARSPAPVPAAPAPLLGAPVAGGGLGVVGWGLIAVGATAAVAIPVVIAGQDDEERTVSPAGSRVRR